MIATRWKTLTAALVLALAATSCVYPGVREFADLSASTASRFEAIATDYQESQERVDALLIAAGDEPLGGVVSDTDIDEMLKVQLALTRYLESLATLASSETVSYHGPLGELTGQLRATGSITADDAASYTRILGMAGEAITSWFRHRKLKTLMPDVNHDIAALTTVLADFSGAYSSQMDEELEALDDAYGSLRSTVADVTELQASREVDAYRRSLHDRQELAKLFADSMTNIAAKHAELAACPGDLDSDRFEAIVRAFSADEGPRNRTMDRKQARGERARRTANEGARR